MYQNYYSQGNPNYNGYYPYYQYSYDSYYRGYPYYETRQQPVRGQATWTEGGQVTQCGIPWSHNEFMTAAVGAETPYQCGQTLRVRNLSSPVPKDILVEVVDKVPDFPANKINLHRKAFLALGANPSVGVINVEITPSPEVKQEEWGRYLLAVAQSAYPGYNVTNYTYVGRKELAPTQIQQTYNFVLKSPQEEIRVQGNVIYNPNTNRVISFDLKEV
ncbi:DUF3889 domain-containing protein [Litchfieldia alkalitelluris]|uniref:DUF3889 domain-containing protein n=1 Tax=Litchfieldia alkalitelluris TaxID=304268 RepID=UPI000996C50E|nr:DUF3889 domain-containing protein [Litchfieldia alkalitelluris]